ncbi:DUF4253 domain-containing protein [Cryptosporangium minutisporangium]|uniref:DUF4253 domain-containing protein n=1 Tax=Cryptosporangium minutisporangium TaxID=113569 RepID=A0ABP6T900_9ACTN
MMGSNDALAALAADPSGGSLGLTLPPGRLRHETEDGPRDQPMLWLSDDQPAADAWTVLRAAHARTGLWPLLLSGLSEDEPDRPWASGELDPTMVTSEPGAHDAEELLAGWWAAYTPDDDSQSAATAPFGTRWPGLAPPGVDQDDPDDAAAEVAYILADADVLTEPRLGLVPSRRGADAPAALGWGGPLNYENDTAQFSAVLRSWEDRFGARLVGLGFDTLLLSVAAPPTDHDHALRVAAEHFAFCPDNIWQGAGSLEQYAADLTGVSVWRFWWD